MRKANKTKHSPYLNISGDKDYCNPQFMYRERNKHDISVDGLYQSPESRWHGIQRLHDKRKGEWVQELQVDGA